MGHTALAARPPAPHQPFAKLFWNDRFGSWFVFTLLLASVALNVALAVYIRELKSPKYISSVTGVTLTPFNVSDLAGKTHLLTFSDTTKPTVLYILSPSCHWCARNLDNIKALAAGRSESYRFVGMSVDVPDLNAYAHSVDHGFPIYSIRSYSVVKELTLGGTPQTLVITPQGKVIRNWIGAFAQENQKEVEEFFSIKLPGLAPERSQL